MQYKSGTLLDELVGKTLIDIMKIKDDVLVIQHSEGMYVIQLHADCCSETWFSDIYGIRHVLHKKVTTLEIDDDHEKIKGYNLEDGRGRQEYDQLYHFIIKTENGGECIICYRNSSNGYYGGWMNVSSEIDLKSFSITYRNEWNF